MNAADFHLRPASEADYPAIRRLIRRVRINPWGLDWRRFLIAVDEGGDLAGCGQLKPHGRAIIELASIAVEDRYRGRGVARLIIEALLAQADRPVYLTARSGLRSLYEKWGFTELQFADMPPYFQRLARLVNIVSPLFADGEYMAVMVLK